MRQLVREPTRGPNLLDLIITDIEGVGCKVGHAVADHKAVIALLKLRVQKSTSISRTVWNYIEVDWESLQKKLAETAWSWSAEIDPDKGAEELTNTILDLAKSCISQRLLLERKSTHPWLNDKILALVERKQESIGTDAESHARDQCSRGIFEEFGKFVQKERARLARMRRGSKGWWSKSRLLLKQRGSVTSIPALKLNR